MTTEKFAEEGWIVRVTMAVASSESKTMNFAAGFSTEKEAEAAVKSYPGVEAEDKVKAGHRLSPKEIAGIKLKHNEVKRYD